MVALSAENVKRRGEQRGREDGGPGGKAGPGGLREAAPRIQKMYTLYISVNKLKTKGMVCEIIWRIYKKISVFVYILQNVHNFFSLDDPLIRKNILYNLK